jgi:hypothetical protein
LVEDSTNPDSSPFVVNADGFLITGAATNQVANLATGNARVQILGGTAPLALFRDADSATAINLEFAKRRATGGLLASGDVIGRLYFSGNDGVAAIPAAFIDAAVDGTPGVNDMPGRLVFSTTADGAATPTEQMRIDASGNVGIGTASPGARLEASISAASGERAIQARNTSTVQFSGATTALVGPSTTSTRFTHFNTNAGGTQAEFAIQKGDGSGGFSAGLAGYNYTSDFWYFSTANTERMRIDASGNVGIGISTNESGFKLHVVGNAFVQNTSGQTTGKVVVDSADNRLVLGSYFEAGVGQYSFISSTDNAETGNIPLLFRTGTTERMRIDSSGNVGIGTSSPGSYGRFATVGGSAFGAAAVFVSDNSASNWARADWDNVNVAGNGIIYQSQTGQFTIRNDAAAPITFERSGGTESMRIDTSGEVYIAGTTDQGAYNLQVNGTGVWGAGAYVNGSDARIKDDIAPIASGLGVVAKLRPVQFRYKESWSKDRFLQPGFIAQELQEALADQPYVEGVVHQGPEYMSVSYQTLIPVLAKAVQELTAKLEAAEARIANLENR